MIISQKIASCLWFDGQAKEAAEFYCSVFKNSTINSASDLVVEFELDGMHFIALNGGPKFKFTEAVSFMVHCQDQAEVDYFWDSLTAEGGEESMCGWCKDKFGLSWQIVPVRFQEMMKTGTPEQKQQVMTRMMRMRKLNINEFELVFNKNKIRT